VEERSSSDDRGSRGFFYRVVRSISGRGFQ
jgi:hypothetical protein